MPDRYEIKPSSESTLALEVFKTGLLAGKRHIFFFEKYGGEILYDAEAPERSTVRVAIESASITLQDKWVKPAQKRHILDAALNEMLEAGHFAQITFVSTNISRKSPSQYEVRGDLTIRGVGKPVTVEAAVNAAGAGRLELDGDAHINMKDYGMKPPSAFMGLIGTKSGMQLRFLVWAERAKSGANVAGR